MTDFTKLSPEDLARVTTRVGRKVEIITTKGREPQPIVGYVGEDSGAEDWSNDGIFYRDGRESCLDLILPPAPRVYYVNVYSGSWHAHASIRDANFNSSPDRLALYKITDDGVSDTLPCEVIERNRGAE